MNDQKAMVALLKGQKIRSINPRMDDAAYLRLNENGVLVGPNNETKYYFWGGSEWEIVEEKDELA